MLSTVGGDWRLLKGDREVRSFSQPTGRQRHSCFAGYPTLHIIVVTDRCNQSCAYCQASARPAGDETLDQDWNAQDLDGIVSFALRHSNERLTVEFQGGEPLLNFTDIQYLVRQFEGAGEAQSKAIQFVLASNLTTLSEEVAAFLAGHSFVVSASLDGLPLLHNAFRKLPWEEEAYARALAGIAMLRRHGLHPGVLTVVTGKSLAYPEEIVDHLVDLGMHRIFLKSVYPLGQAQKAWAQVGLEPGEYGRFWKRAVKRCFAHNRAEIPVVERTLALLVRKVLWGQEPCYVDLSSPCGAVHGQIVYDLQGNIYPCDEGRFGAAFPVGNVASSTFQELVQHPSTLAFRRTSQTVEEYCGTCAYRPWCGRCPALAHHQRGRLDLPSPAYFYCHLLTSVFDAFFELVAECPEEIEVVARIVSLTDLFESGLGA